MKLTTKVNPITVGNNHFEGGELSIEFTPAEALSIGPQLKAIGNTINNGDIINKIPQVIEFLANNKSKDAQTLQTLQGLQAQIAELATRLNEAVHTFASAERIQLAPPQSQQPVSVQTPFVQDPYYTPHTTATPITDFREEEKAPEAEKSVVPKSLSEIEAARKRNEREVLSNLWDTIKASVHGDNTSTETRDKITWGNMEVKFDRVFPKISIRLNAIEDQITAIILVNIYADQSGARPNKIKISDINSNLDLYENGYDLGFYQRKVMALINGMYEEQLKK